MTKIMVHMVDTVKATSGLYCWHKTENKRLNLIFESDLLLSSATNEAKVVLQFSVSHSEAQILQAAYVYNVKNWYI